MIATSCLCLGQHFFKALTLLGDLIFSGLRYYCQIYLYGKKLLRPAFEVAAAITLGQA